MNLYYVHKIMNALGIRKWSFPQWMVFFFFFDSAAYEPDIYLFSHLYGQKRWKIVKFLTHIYYSKFFFHKSNLKQSNYKNTDKNYKGDNLASCKGVRKSIKVENMHTHTRHTFFFACGAFGGSFPECSRAGPNGPAGQIRPEVPRPCDTWMLPLLNLNSF